MSEEVKRYDHAGDYCGPKCGFEESVDGDWIRASDYDALLEDNKLLQATQYGSGRMQPLTPVCDNPKP